MGIDKNIVNRYFVDDLVKEQMLHLQKKIRELLCSNLTFRDQNLSLQETIRKNQECIDELINGQKDSKIVEDLNMKIIRAEKKVEMLMENVDTVNRENEVLLNKKQELETSLERYKSLLLHSNSDNKKIERKEPDFTVPQNKMLKTKLVTMWTESSSNIDKEINTNDQSTEAQTDIDELLDDADNINDKDTNLDELFDDFSATVGAPVEIKKEDVEMQTIKKTKKKTRKAKCQCDPCKRPPCEKCVPCLDAPRNNGPNKVRQRCIERQCTGGSVPNKKSTFIREKKNKIRSSQLSCPLPGCNKMFSLRSSWRTHISFHFKSQILQKYPWKKNNPCQICGSVVRGNISQFVYHVAYVHKVVSQLLPEGDERLDFVKTHFY